jgi:AraC-like DNA-binding protein
MDRSTGPSPAERRAARLGRTSCGGGPDVQVVETADPDVVQDTLSRAYGKVQLSITSAEARLRIVRRALGPVELHAVEADMRFRADAAPKPAHIIGRVNRGRVAHLHGTVGYQYGAGDVYLAGAEDGYRSTVDTVVTEIAVFGPDLLGQVAEAAPGLSSRPVRFTGYAAVSPAAAAVWNRTYDHLRDLVDTLPAGEMPLVAGAGARQLAAAALSVFPNNVLREPTIEDRLDAHPGSLRRAIGFIEENAERDLSSADIASAAHVTIRALQLAFRRHLDTTPMAYLRRVRMHRAYRDLRDADPTGDATVTDIALRWGFTNPSRFALAYRCTFGVPPSHTLRS